MAGATKSVTVFIHGDAKQAIAEIKRMAGSVDAESTAMGDKMAAFGKKAALALGGAAIAVAGFSVKMADDFEKNNARLDTAITNSGGTVKAWQPQVDAVNSKLEKWGFNNAEVEGSLARLVPVTKSSADATNLQALAANIAAGRHLDLESATQLLVKVQTGHVSLLGRLGINTKDLTGKTIDQATAIQRLTDMYGGSAARQADTFGGKMKVLKTEAEDLGVKIGMALIPVIEDLVTWIEDGVNWFEKHKAAAIALGVVVGGPLVVVMTALTVLKVAEWAGKVSAAFDLVTGNATAAALATEQLDAASFAAASGGVAGVGGASVAAAGGMGLAEGASVGLGGALLGLGASLAVAYGGWKLYNIVTATDSAGAQKHIDEINGLAAAVQTLGTKLLTSGGTADWFINTFMRLPAEKGLPKALMDLGVTVQDVNNAAAFGPAAFEKWLVGLEHMTKTGSKDWVAMGNAVDDVYASLTKAAQQQTAMSLFTGNTSDAIKGLDAQIQTLDMKGYTDHVKGANVELDTFGKQAWAAAEQTTKQTGSLQAGTYVLDVYLNKLIAQGEAFGLSAQKAKDLADKILGIPTDHQTKLEVEAEEAKQHIAEFVYSVDVALNNIHWNIPQPGNAPVGTPTVHGSVGGFIFDSGGFVPGPIGAPLAATVHGGEVVLNPKQQDSLFGGHAKAGGTTVVINVAGSVLTERDLMEVVVKGINNAGGPKLNARAVKSR